MKSTNTASLADIGIEIPLTELSPRAMRSMIEEFVLREGTDYGHTEIELDRKVSQVARQLEKGEAAIFFNPDTETFDIHIRRRF